MSRNSFGRALADARAARSISQTELALASGVTQSNVSAWEAGRWAPEPEALFAIEKTLKVPPGRLSRHLGYLPAKADEPPPSVEDAIAADPRLDNGDRRALLALYRELAKRRSR